jgi:hypothetical protein
VNHDERRGQARGVVVISISAKKLARDLTWTSRLIFPSSASIPSNLLEPQANQLYIAWMELLQRLGLAVLIGHRN